ncbi:juvenile hormone esterase [Leptinotarsa decemlineata]|uniref:juvenile hormone esterase n=1 Tax=Leptinotarsa decemlineata TaxID=7539 RepID=UPI003D3071F9
MNTIQMFFRISLGVFCTAVIVGLLLGQNADNDDEAAYIITLPLGKIQGHALKSHKEALYYAFQEIPYASPPVETLRFKDPVPPRPWTGILNTTKNKKICMQLYKDDPRETEDCLYLNVYTPTNPDECDSSQLLPVYVFVHGGFFCKGDGSFQSFGPQFFMDYGIVLVTLNYRLGAFGFLSTADEVISGNFGLKDQNLALKWVKDNIHLFGGDSSKITLGGQSAAGGAVGHHLLSKQSKGLFRGLIMQSGSPLCGKMFQKSPRYFAYKLGSLLNSDFGSNNSSRELLELLQNVSAEDIKGNSDMEIPFEMRNSVGNEDNRIWAPVEDGQFVQGSMHENLKLGRFNLVPILMGITSEEQLRFNLNKLKSKAKYFDSNTSFLINGNLNMKAENKQPAGEMLKKLYTNSSFGEEFGSFVRYISDAKYTTPVARHADLQSKYTDVFFYQFSYHGKLNFNTASVPGAERVGHAEDNYYLFKVGFHSKIDKVPESDLLTQSRMLRLWTNFMKYLNPTPFEDPLLAHVVWPKVKPDEFLYLDIGNSLSIKTNPKEYHNWKKIFNEFAEDIQTTY